MAARSSEQATKSAGEAEEILGDGVSLHKASMLLPSAPKLQSTFDRNMENLVKDNLLKYFTEYALKEGSMSALSIGGLKSLLQNQFAEYLKGAFSLDNIIKSFDTNKDGKVTFDEFVALITRITTSGH
ncbi:hypothetical protein Y1Q_0022452 [Alligator mississippiensis]|uniref:EF-hand domain-containing protein n=1 Tax=Alligator mississippiensis TaxID=8496 RepID=A0A151N0H7_ALLMI|nr:hypothetical protein Y1Q_0022452 [Alligator mississippiensis]